MIYYNMNIYSFYIHEYKYMLQIHVNLIESERFSTARTKSRHSTNPESLLSSIHSHCLKSVGWKVIPPTPTIWPHSETFGDETYVLKTSLPANVPWATSGMSNATQLENLPSQLSGLTYKRRCLCYEWEKYWNTTPLNSYCYYYMRSHNQIIAFVLWKKYFQYLSNQCWPPPKSHHPPYIWSHTPLPCLQILLGISLQKHPLVHTSNWIPSIEYDGGGADKPYIFRSELPTLKTLLF